MARDLSRGDERSLACAFFPHRAPCVRIAAIMQCPSCQTEVDASQRFCPKCGGLVGADAKATDPLLGTTIGGKYKIIRLLGEGGMGCVYEGEQMLGTKVRRIAIKTLHAHLSKDPKILARFQREVGTIAELEHPNTIQVYDFGSTSDGQLFIAMEFVQGHNVAEILEKEGPMPATRVEGIFEQIAGSLGEAHQHGIVHRDLKPDNIVLTERAGKKDFVKVLDFGIAKHSGEDDKNEPKLTQAGMVLGTPPYMSPEQFTGKAVDARSDIYSLGIVIYEMLCGKLPFKADTAWEWASQHMTVAPIAIESTVQGANLPERIRAAIGKALAKVPDERWQTVQEFYEAFANGVAAGPAVTSGPRNIAAKGGTAMMGGPVDAFATTANPYGGADAAGANAPRAKTEIGAPIDASAFGGAPPAPYGAPAVPYGAPPSPYGSPPSPMGGGGYGPPPVMAAAPYAGAIPAPPVRGGSRGGGGGRGVLVGVALLLVVGAGAAAFFALRPASRSASSDLGSAASTPIASTPAADPTPTAPPDPTPPSSDNGLAPLSAGTTKPKPTATTPAPHPTTKPSTTPTTPVPPSTPPEPTTPPTNPNRPAPPAPPMINGQPAACAAAATMRAMGRMSDYTRYANACRSQGGTPP
jgi:tRNA A-37 threonylcarbamoyl transferase component Bud32